MSELKTLKDLLLNNPFYAHHGYASGKDLKQEAIKWVKHIEQRTLPHPKNVAEIIDGISIDWIKHFFNLTDEDLK